MRSLGLGRWGRSGAAAAMAAVVLAVASSVLAQSGGGYDVEWSVLGTAGDQFVSGGGYQLGFTLGQDQEPGISSGGGYQIMQEYWAGGGFPPTAVRLAGLWVEARGDTLVICWETMTEIDNLGFNLYRSDSGQPGSFAQLNAELIPSQAPGSPIGAYYEWSDAAVAPRQTYFYLLEVVDIYGQSAQYGPVQGLLPAVFEIYLPLVSKGS